MFNKRNSVNMYGVFKSSDNYSNDNLLCVTTTEKEAYEYITRKTYLDNENHYKMWCNVHNKNIEEAFEEYITTVLALDEDYKFSIVKMQYTNDELASIIRCMLGYELVGASYESDSEREFNEAVKLQDESDDDSTITNNKVC